MKYVSVMCAFSLLVLGSFTNDSDFSVHASPAQAGSQSSRYPYCNVFTSSSCFGVSQGDRVTLTIPADYQLYEITLSYGISATVYAGRHADMDAFDSAASCRTSSRDDICRRLELPGGLKYLYYSEREDSSIVVTVRGVNEANLSLARDFLLGFRHCRRRDEGVACMNDKMFDVPK